MIKVSLHPPSIPEAAAKSVELQQRNGQWQLWTFSLGSGLWLQYRKIKRVRNIWSSPGVIRSMKIYENVKAFCGNALEAGHSRQPVEYNGLWLLLPCFVSWWLAWNLELNHVPQGFRIFNWNDGIFIHYSGVLHRCPSQSFSICNIYL